jgi:hypothetical protein
MSNTAPDYDIANMSSSPISAVTTTSTAQSGLYSVGPWPLKRLICEDTVLKASSSPDPLRDRGISFSEALAPTDEQCKEIEDFQRLRKRKGSAPRTAEGTAESAVTVRSATDLEAASLQPLSAIFQSSELTPTDRSNSTLYSLLSFYYGSSW